MSKAIKVYIVILLVSYGISWATDQPPVEFQIVPKPHEGYEVKDGKVFYRKGQAGVMIQPANETVIAQYFTERGSKVPNPFLNAEEEFQNSTYFLVSLINRSKGTLTFTPQYVALKIKTDASFPMDFTLLLGIMQDMDAYSSKLVEQSVFHSPETIQPGNVSTKFLIFPPLPKKESELKMEFDYSFFESKELKMFFYFLHQKKGGGKDTGTIYKNH